jgi:hypothetical protein
MVDKDITCVGLAIQRLDAWRHWARKELIGCLGESWRRPGWKCRPVELVEGIPVLGGEWHCVRLVLRVASCRYCNVSGGFTERRASPTFVVVVSMCLRLIDSFSAAYGCRLFCCLCREVQRMSAGRRHSSDSYREGIFTLTKEEG